MIHPFDVYKKCNLKDLKREEILEKVFEDGEILVENKTISRIAEYNEYRFSLLPEEHKRFEFPHIYKVGISPELLKLRDKLINQRKEKKL